MIVRREYLGAALLLAVLSVMPVLLEFNDYYTLLLFYVVLYSTMVVAWNIIGGFAGQFDLAASAYQGLGGFITGLLLLRLGITPILGIFVGGAGAVGLAAFIGYPTFRYGVKDVWYALSTYALVFIVQSIFLIWEAVGGPVEQRFPAVGQSAYYLSFTHNYPYFYLILVAFAAAVLVNIKIRYGKVGYYLMAIRENEDAATMLGVDVRKYKLVALIIYALIVGISGGLFVSVIRYVHPSIFDPWISLQTGVLGIIGGIGNLAGPPVAALLLSSLSEYTRDFLGGVTILGQTIFGLQQMLYAIIVIIVVLFKPQGLGFFFQTLIDRFLSGIKPYRKMKLEQK